MSAKHSTPVSLIITQVLMLFSFGPLCLGLLLFLLHALVTKPSSVVSLRALFGLVGGGLLTFIFLYYGLGGLWKRKIYGYWLAVLFLVGLNVKNMYVVVPALYRRMTIDQSSSSLASMGTWLVYDMGLQLIMLSLVFAVMLKVVVGKRERDHFRASVPTTSDGLPE